MDLGRGGDSGLRWSLELRDGTPTAAQVADFSRLTDALVPNKVALVLAPGEETSPAATQSAKRQRRKSALRSSVLLTIHFFASREEFYAEGLPLP
jgi:hypothetical protein